MMTEKFKQVIKREIDKLPKEAQDAINAIAWADIAEQIGKNHFLDQNEITDFQLQTLFVLIGLEEGDLYAINIEEYVGTSKDEATKMADEILEKIFTPIISLIEENIKKDLKNKSVNTTQNIDFILSGGNYFTFIMPNRPKNTITEIKEQTTQPIGKRSIQDIKDKLIS